MTRPLFALPFSLALISLIANPQDPVVTAGSAQFSEKGHVLEIKPSDGAILNWRDFSIEPNEITRFIQPSSSARVLNRVTGGEMSSLMGMLEANGQIFLLNRSGVLIGKDAKIKTGGFFATPFDLKDEDFLENRTFALDPSSEASIINQGQIEADDGSVYLIAYRVVNEGEIAAANVTIGAGKEWIVRAANPNRPSIRLDEIPEDLSNPYSCAIRHSGTIRAVGFEEGDGVLRLVSEGEISFSGSGEALSLKKGGKIELFARNISLLDSARLSSDGEKGGGQICGIL